MTFEASLTGRDQLKLSIELDGDNIRSAQLEAIGCLSLLKLVAQWRPKLSGTVRDIEIPTQNDHASVLLRELLLKTRGDWILPYTEDELCHCRAIATEKVLMAIKGGCHTPEAVSRETSASTACGTCRPNVEKLIGFVLK